MGIRRFHRRAGRKARSKHTNILLAAICTAKWAIFAVGAIRLIARTRKCFAVARGLSAAVRAADCNRTYKAVQRRRAGV